jgi:L-asparaginase II
MKGRGITKVGGEAIRGMVIKTNKYGIVGIAQKIMDGAQRANEIATMTILNYLDLLKSKEKESLVKYEKKKLFNHRKIQVGHIEGELNQSIAQKGCNQTAQLGSI